MTGTSFYQPGYRVALRGTDDPDVALPPGATGTVWRYRADQTMLTVAWDNGTTAPLRLGPGIVLDLLPPDFGAAPNPAAAISPDSWEQLLDGLMDSADREAENTAQRWFAAAFDGQDRATSVVTALRIADGVEGHNSTVIFQLPLWQLDHPDNPPVLPETGPLSPPDWWRRIAPPDAPSWAAPGSVLGSELIRAYASVHDQRLLGLILAHCTRVAAPTGDGISLAHLHPDDITPGCTGVFAGDWIAYTAAGPDHSRCSRLRIVTTEDNGPRMTPRANQPAPIPGGDEIAEPDWPETDPNATPLSVGDPVLQKTRLLSRQCDTCIFSPGNLMHLNPGRLKQMVGEARAADSYIVCHETLPSYDNGAEPAICRGFYDRYSTNDLRRIARLWGFLEVEPPAIT